MPIEPADHRPEEGAGELGDARVGDVDRAGVAEHVEQRALPGEQTGQGHHERRHPELGDPQALEQPDGHAGGDGGGDRGRGRPAVLHVEHGHDGGGEAAHGADRQVDLAQQQHQHDAHRDGAHRGDLQHEVGEVHRRQEAAVEELEDGPDDEDAEHHREVPQLALGQAAAEGAGGAGQAGLLDDQPAVGGQRLGVGQGHHLGALPSGCRAHRRIGLGHDAPPAVAPGGSSAPPAGTGRSSSTGPSSDMTCSI